MQTMFVAVAVTVMGIQFHAKYHRMCRDVTDALTKLILPLLTHMEDFTLPTFISLTLSDHSLCSYDTNAFTFL